MKWIDVAHELPPVGEEVLVWATARMVYQTWIAIYDPRRYGDDEFVEWFSRDEEYELYPTHWMTIPDQP